jgi:hypothetical protein
MVDTTGSMHDELSYLKVEMADVIQAVRDEYGQSLEIRVSMNFYRDVNDTYVVRAFPFTTDVDLALSQLSAQNTAGGGDLPEAMDQALYNGIYLHEWTPDARARLMFLVADAPYHDTASAQSIVGNALREAATLGVRIIPVEASGTDVDTQFLMRTLDVLTGGTYVFLTDDSGIGGPHLDPKVGPYEVEPLNELMIRLITDALA